MASFQSIDAYIDQAEEFAKPILRHLRAAVHACSPHIEETFKWNFPHFLYKGKILCSMASFKQHAAFTIWLGGHMQDTHQLFQKGDNSGMGQFGKISSLDDLPEKAILLAYLQEAIQLTDAGKTNSGGKKAPAKAMETPDELSSALDAVPTAAERFSAFSQSHRNEYIEWITEAKTESTRQRRIDQAIEWITEGKSRHWKYGR